MKSIFVLSIFSLVVQAINGEEVSFANVVKTFNAKCAEKKVPVKSIEFMVKIAPNADQIQHNLEAPIKPFMTEEQISTTLKQMPDQMTIVKLKLEFGARDFVHSLIDSINTEQIVIEKLEKQVAAALSFAPQNEEFLKTFNHWATEKNTKVDHLKKVENSIDAMQSYYNQLHAIFDKEITEAEKIKSNLRNDMHSAITSFAKLNGSDSKAEVVVEEARLHMSKISENQKKLLGHLIVVEDVLDNYNGQRSSWAEYLIGMKDSFEIISFEKVVNVFNGKCTEKKVPMKPLDFMVKITPNADQIQHNLKVPMKPYMSEEKISTIVKHMPDEMTIMKLKLEFGARDFVHSVIDSINTKQTTIEKLQNEIVIALAFAPHKGDYLKAFNHWATDKNPKVDHLKKVENSIDSMQSYYNQLHAIFDKEIIEAENIKSKIENAMNLANKSFGKLEVSEPHSEAAKAIVEEARLHMSEVTENQIKLLNHLNVVKAVLADYNLQRTTWAEYLIGMKTSIQVPPPTHVDQLTSTLKTLKL